MTVNQRIKNLLYSENYDVKKIPKLIGMTNKMVKNYIEGDATPSYKIITLLFKEFPTLNPQWLFFGKGSKFIIEEEFELDKRELTILKGKIAEMSSKHDDLEKKYDKLKEIYKELSGDLKLMATEFGKMDIEGTITRFLKANNME